MKPLYTLRVPKGLFFLDASLLLLVDLAAICFTAHDLIGDLGLLVLLAVELILLIFIFDLRLCMSTNPTTLKKLAAAIQQAIPKQQ